MKVADSEGAAESVSFTVKLEVPLDPVGVPEITPVAEFRARPVGRLPEEIDHV